MSRVSHELYHKGLISDEQMDQGPHTDIEYLLMAVNKLADEVERQERVIVSMQNEINVLNGVVQP